MLKKEKQEKLIHSLLKEYVRHGCNFVDIFRICKKDYLMASYIVFSSKHCCDRGKSLKMLLFVSILVKLLLQCNRKVTNLLLDSNWHETRN